MNKNEEQLKHISQEFPYAGEFFYAKNKVYKETVFFVHFYDGSKRQLLKHIRLVNQLGYDAFAFNLEGSHRDYKKIKAPISAQRGWGLKHLYADQIEMLLNALSGNKIIYAFSNPCASAIEAMACRHCVDVSAMICDSGPTARFLPSVIQLLTHEIKVTPLPLKLIAAPLFALNWSPHLHKDLVTDLNTFPQGFPLLSIRGWKDKLIPPGHIDEVFDPHTQLDWQKLSLPEAGHLVGLRDFKEEYIPTVEAFLKSVSTKI